MAGPHDTIDFGQNIPPLFDTCIIEGTVTAVDIGSNTVDVTTSDYGALTDVPVFFHCEDVPDVSKGAKAFLVNDVVLIMAIGAASGMGSPDFKVVGWRDGLQRQCKTGFLVIKITGNLRNDWCPFTGGTSDPLEARYTVWDIEEEAVATIDSITLPASLADIQDWLDEKALQSYDDLYTLTIDDPTSVPYLASCPGSPPSPFFCEDFPTRLTGCQSPATAYRYYDVDLSRFPPPANWTHWQYAEWWAERFVSQATPGGTTCTRWNKTNYDSSFTLEHRDWAKVANLLAGDMPQQWWRFGSTADWFYEIYGRVNQNNNQHGLDDKFMFHISTYVYSATFDVEILSGPQDPSCKSETNFTPYAMIEFFSDGDARDADPFNQSRNSTFEAALTELWEDFLDNEGLDPGDKPPVTADYDVKWYR